MRSPVTRIEVFSGIAVLVTAAALIAVLLAGDAVRRALGLAEPRVMLSLDLDRARGIGPGAPVQYVGQTVGEVVDAQIREPGAPADAQIRVNFYVSESFFERQMGTGAWRVEVQEPVVALPGVGTTLALLRSTAAEGGVVAEPDAVLPSVTPEGLLADAQDLPEKVRGVLEQVTAVLASADAVLVDVQQVSTRVAAGEGAVGRVLLDQKLADRVVASVASAEALLADLQGATDDVVAQRLPVLLDDVEAILAEVREASRGLPQTARGIDASLLKADAILGSIQRNPFIRGGIAEPAPEPGTVDLLPRGAQP